MHGQNNIHLMPDYSNYDLWDEYMGRLWLGLIGMTNIRSNSTLVEVAPGATAKIAHALSVLPFNGKIYLIEPHADVSKTIEKKTKRLLPEAEVILIQKNYNEVVIDDDIHAILANHVFDDFLSAEAATHAHAILFQDISREEEQVLQLLRNIWQPMVTNDNQLNAMKLKIRKDWRCFLERHNPATVILSQYASSYFDKHDLSIINHHAKALFQDVRGDMAHQLSQHGLQKTLSLNENYGNKWIGHELLNAENWAINEQKH